MSPESIDPRVAFMPCQNCAEPLIVENGEVQRPDGGRLTFWIKNELPVLTLHHRLCSVMNDGSPTYR